MSEATGWGIVPPTILRDGPFGEGMVQAFVEADPDVDVVAMVARATTRGCAGWRSSTRSMNNTDRKGGHILPVDGGRQIHGVDHGVCFSPVPKLRTVLWGWRGEPLRRRTSSTGWSGSAPRSTATSGRTLRELLSRPRSGRTRRRVESLLRAGRFPHPSPTWPAIPWPPF